MSLKKILQFSIGPIGAAALSLITLPFVTWFFTVEDVGRLTMLQVVLGLTVSFFSLAMHQAYVREYHEENDKQSLFKSSVIPGLIVLVVLCIIISVLPFSVSTLLFGIDSALLTFLLIIAVFSSFFINFLAHVVRMQERGLVFSATQIAPKLFLLIFIGLIMLLNLESDFRTLIFMNTLAVVSSLLIFLFLTRETWIGSVTKRVNLALVKKMLNFSLPLVVSGVAYWALTTMDRFFIRSLAGFEELGVYALSVALAGSVSVISTVFSNLWHPILYKWVKNGVDYKNVQRVIDNMVLFVAFIWSATGLISFIVPWFLPIKYKAIEYLIVACVSMPLFYLLSEVTGIGIGVSRKSKYSMFASISAFLVNAVLNYLLIPTYGASGAALATIIAFFVFFSIRTEAGARAWYSFPRVKIYIVMIFYVIATSVMVLNKATLMNFYIVWLILFFVTCAFYISRLSETLNLLINFFKKRV